MRMFNRFDLGVARDAAPDAGGGGSPPSSPPLAAPLSDGEVMRLRAGLAAPPQAPIQQQAPPPVDKAELEKVFWKDPLAMSAAIAQQAANNAIAQNGAASMDTMIETAKQQARGTDPIRMAFFDKYLGEIETKIKSTTPPQFHGNLTVWKNAVNFVLGEHADDFADMRSKGLNQSAAVHTHDGPSGPSVKAPTAAPKDKLSDEQRQIARSLGVSEDDYRTGLDLRNRQHGREASPWDEAITTDNSRGGKVAYANRPKGGK